MIGKRSHAVATALVLVAGLSLGLGVPATADGATPTCLGRPATVVGSSHSYELDGTDGDDVIVTNGSASVSAGSGDDLVCVTGHAPSDDGYQDVGISAGPGDDTVSTGQLGHQDVVEALLGTGADTFAGGSESDWVIDGVMNDETGESTGDADADTITTGRGGLDLVEVGDGGPLTDHVRVSSAGQVIATTSGLGTNGRLEGGRSTELVLVDDEPGAWQVDAAARRADLNAEPRLSWTGFGRYTWAVPGTLDFRGTTGDDHVVGPLVAARLGDGDDVAYAWSSKADATSSGVIAGGPGADKVRLMAGRGLEDQGGGGLVPFTPADVRLDVGDHTARFGRRPPLRLVGFETYGAQTDGRATLLGGPGPDQLFGAACRLSMSGRSGADVLHEEPDQGSAGLDNPICPGHLVATLSGGPGADHLVAAADRGRLIGGPGDDRLAGHYPGRYDERGGAGADLLRGGEHDDTLRGGPGADRLLGDRGDDRLFGGPGDDQGVGGTGHDVCVMEHSRDCERVRGTVTTPAPSPPRPHSVLVHDAPGDVSRTSDPVHPGTAQVSPATGNGDIVAVRTSYRRGLLRMTTHLRALTSRDPLTESVGLQYDDGVQFRYADVVLRTGPDGTVRVRAQGRPGRACRAADGSVDRRGATIELSLPATCLGSPRWVRTRATVLRTDDRRQPGFVAVDDAPDQTGKFSRYGPRAFA